MPNPILANVFVGSHPSLYELVAMTLQLRTRSRWTRFKLIAIVYIGL